MQRRTKLFFALTSGLLPAVLYSYVTGPDPGYSGAPGDQTCATAGCHTGTALNGGGGSVQFISSSGASYTPGQQQTLIITIADAKAKVYGFQASARLDSNPTTGQAGDFTAGTRQQVLCSNGRTKGSGGCPSSSPIEYIEHNNPFTTNTISVSWTAPSSDVGNVTIYVAANAANGDGRDTGDHIYTASLQLSPVASISSKPTIRSNGVASVQAFNANAGVAPGTWLEIFGTNLSATTRPWQSSDFNGNTAPTSLDGVSVTIGGKNAYISYISSTQVNVQVPDGIPVGTGVPLVLTNSQGESDPYILQTSDIAPALLAPTSFKVGGKQYVFATFATTAAGGLQYVGATGSIVGLTMSPAKAGDIITLYGIGFGPVTPNTAAGTLPTESTSLTNQVTFLFGQTTATVLYAGLSTDSVGLYQFKIEVPNVAGGDWPLTVQVGGTTLNQTIYVTTQ